MKELLYQKIFNAICDDIKDGRLNPGDRLDGVRELALHWQTSTNTVLKALDELEQAGYIRKTRGRGIFVESTQSYGKEDALESEAFEGQILDLFLYDMDVPFNRILISAVEKASAAYGFSLTVKETADLETAESRSNPLIIVPASAPAEAVTADAEKPVVYCGDFSPPPGFQGSYAVVDAYGGYYRAAELLFSAGRERIAYIGGSGSIESEAGWNACRDLLSGTNKGFRRDYAVTAGGWAAEKGEEAMENLLLGGEFPDGIVCSNDALAAGALKACRRAGLSVPGDIALTGAGDGSIAPLLEPPLTSLKMSAESLAFIAVGYLVNVLRGRLKDALRVRIDMELAERESTSGIPEAGDGSDWL